MKVRVIESVRSGERLKRFVLQSLPGEALPHFAPGSHIALSFDMPIVGRMQRRYSLVNMPPTGKAPPTYEIVVQHELQGQGGSAWLFSNLGVGATIDVDGPFGHFVLAGGSGPVLLIAGGIGITPILSMARACDSSGRHFDLHYFVRSADEAPLREEVEQLRGGSVVLHEGVTPDDVPSRLDALCAALPDKRPIHVCGPQGLIDTTLSVGRALGWINEDLHHERFTARGLSGERAFRVRLATSGICVEVAADQSILQALSASGVGVGAGCGAGVCGSCMVAVVNGRIDHRDEFFSLEEKAANEFLCVCVSRAIDDEITLDL